MNAATRAYVALIVACGYRVFMRQPGDEYCYFTDAEGKRIGYAQWSSHRPSVSTVHIPCRSAGTGYAAGGDITPETLAHALTMTVPYWDAGNAGNVRKWLSWSAFQRASSFNGEYVEVTLSPEADHA